MRVYLNHKQEELGKKKRLRLHDLRDFLSYLLEYLDQTICFVFNLGKDGKKKRRPLFADDVLNKNPASSYSPTQLPVQYHRRWKA